MAARKQTPPRLSDDDKRFIYQVLRRNFSFDEEYPLANLGWCFLREDIDKADYGFIKLKPMLEEMGGFVSTFAKEIGGVSQSMFMLHEHPPYEDDASEPAARDDAGASSDGRSAEALRGDGKASVKDTKNIIDAVDEKDTDNKSNGKIEIDSKSQKDTNKGKPRSEARPSAAKERSSSREGGLPSEEAPGREASAQPDRANSAVAAPAEGGLAAAADAGRIPEAKDDAAPDGGAACAQGRRRTGSSDGDKAKETPDAREGARRRRAASRTASGADAAPGEGDAAVPACDDASGASSDSAAPEPASKPAKAAKAESAKTRASAPHRARRPRRAVPGKALEHFAHLGSWPEFLAALAEMALEEPWDFSEVPGIDAASGSAKRYDILHNYIRYTFYRLTLEDKVGFSAEEDFAAFNTGLVDKHYEDIYACFEASEPESRRAWTFSGFCTAGTGRNGKRLVRELSPLPQPASYLQRKEDLLFDLDREVVCDVRHIVVDNVHRLPVGFLRDELASSRECRGILAGIDELTEQGRAARFERLRQAISADARLFGRLSTSINAAIDQARRQVRWNYKTAVPAYYPRTNSMNLLLPLNLTDSTTPDVALVVELQKSGNYQGQTIVTMAQAYRDARLLCRPYIDWLSPASIIDASGDEEEED